MDDMMLALMLLRIYFVIYSYTTYSIHSSLDGLRTAKKFGFEPDLSYYVRAALVRRPFLTYILLTGVTLCSLAFILRIFERPYAFEMGQYDFNLYSGALWLTVISATTVGYGNMIASTPFGRLTSIVIIFVGIFLTTLLIAQITTSFEFHDDKKNAIIINTNRRFATKVIVRGLQYNRIRNRRYKMLRI